MIKNNYKRVFQFQFKNRNSYVSNNLLKQRNFIKYAFNF